MNFNKTYWLRSLIAVVLSIVSNCMYAGLELRLKGGIKGKTEDSNEPVFVVAQGDEYTIQVTSDYECGDNLTVHGVENAAAFDVSRGGNSSSMTIINGRTTTRVTYTYSIRPLVVGSYNLGPAIVEDENGRQLSNTVKVRVVEPAAYDTFAGKAGAQRQALKCSMVVDVHEVYVGQPLMLKIVIEDDGNVMERALQPPVFGSLVAEPVGKASSQQKMVNGHLKVITQQEYRLIADAPGTYTIDPATAHFVVPEGDRDPMMGSFFGSFFGPSGKKRSVRSNSMIVGVKPLPLSAKPVDAVGVFTQVQLRVSKQVVELNEPFMVHFAITGIGNFDSIVAPTLVCSDDVSMYPSTASIDAGAAGTTVKTFEYIAQVSVAGEQVIPAQSFYYFDTASGSYQTIQTEPLVVMVKQAKQSVALVFPEKKNEKVVSTEQSLFEQARSVPVLPWWVFVVVGLLLLVVILRDLLRGAVVWALEAVGVTSNAKRQRIALLNLIEQQNVVALHAFFVEFLARGWRCKTHEIDADFVQYKVQEWGWEADRCNGFAAYIEKCSQAAFASQTIKEVMKTELLDKALYWYELVSGEFKGQ